MKTVSKFPWWFLVIALVGLFLFYSFYNDQTYAEIFAFLKEGVLTTIKVTLIAYAIAVTVGLLTGLARVSKNPIVYNIATLYVQVMRGVPILVTILYTAFVVTPWAITLINNLGVWLAEAGVLPADNPLAALQIRAVDFVTRAIIALAISYGAFSAEIFRAGIESIGRGQMEAARSLGMSYLQAMRYIILPQAVRRVLPPLGNDFIAMLKESSLVSALGVRDITQLGKLYASSSFRYLETYTAVAFLYLTMTIILSLGVKAMEKRLKTDE
ncbi:MAG: amino acid ABC transporter permease [Anaerolineales bacterium]|nr:amino acid ABC transporter permease [Anaerolineales bacterium]